VRGPRPELLLVDMVDGRIAVSLAELPPSQVGLLPELAPVGAKAVYIRRDERSGLVLVAGGEVTHGGGSAKLYEVIWEPGTLAPFVQLRRTLPIITDRVAGRTEHTLTSFELPGGEPAALLYGGKDGFGDSVARPVVLYPFRLERGALNTECSTLLPVDSTVFPQYRRHGHRAVYVPEKGRVVIVGGETRLGDRSAGRIDKIYEFDVATRLFNEATDPLYEERIGPQALLVPGSSKIVIVGGYDGSSALLPIVDICTVAVIQRPLVSAFGAWLPRGALDSRTGLFACGIGGDPARLYILGGDEPRLWRLPLEALAGATGGT
jgi:hypothetical protein